MGDHTGRSAKGSENTHVGVSSVGRVLRQLGVLEVKDLQPSQYFACGLLGLLLRDDPDAGLDEALVVEVDGVVLHVLREDLGHLLLVLAQGLLPELVHVFGDQGHLWRQDELDVLVVLLLRVCFLFVCSTRVRRGSSYNG